MTRLTVEQRQKELDKLADRFLRGEITVEDFEKKRQQYMPNYSAVMASLATNTKLSRCVCHRRRNV